MFCRGRFRTSRSEQSVGELLAAVGLRQPPRGGVNQGKALYRGELRLAFTEDCYRGQALPVGDSAGAARGVRGRLVAITERRGGQLQRPGQF